MSSSGRRSIPLLPLLLPSLFAHHPPRNLPPPPLVEH
jgi:hypothetical protein